MMTSTISRRIFLTAAAAGACGLGTRNLLAADTLEDKLRLGMMLQGNSVKDLQEKAKAIAKVGFNAVQLTFFFLPTADELKILARTLKELRLKTYAFGTYINLFRPDDSSFMGASQSVMKIVADHADLFDCNQFVSWSGSYSTQFGGSDPRNQTPEAIAEIQRAIREVILPILKPINGSVAFEPYYPHVFGTVERAKAVMAPFSAKQVGMLLDPPNFISPALYSDRKTVMQRLFGELGDRIHLVHFKDMKLSTDGKNVELPGPGSGEMDYPLLLSEIRKLKRPLPCIIEHIKAEEDEMSKTKVWVEKQMQ